MIDLHMHTIYSDGSKTLDELLKMCQEKKLEVISITDHNSCKAYYDENINNKTLFNGIIIKGCEVNAYFQKTAIEILSYNINPDIVNRWFNKYFSEEMAKLNTQKIYNRFTNILDEKGIIYNKDNIRHQKDVNELIERPILEEIIRHPENESILKDYFSLPLKVFFRQELTNPNSEYFLNRMDTYPTAQEVIDIIHESGGKAFLAHPFEYKLKDTIKFIEDLMNNTNLDGIECFHPSATEDEMHLLVNFAKENGLYISGGSDYHGKLKPDIDIGVGTGNLNISKEIIKYWK